MLGLNGIHLDCFNVETYFDCAILYTTHQDQVQLLLV